MTEVHGEILKVFVVEKEGGKKKKLKACSQ